MKRALITGINGQDGSYLAEFLLEKGYKVFGTHRSDSLQRIEHIKNKITLIPANLTNEESLRRAVEQSQPDEVYNLSAISQVSLSFKEPELTREVNYHGVGRLLRILKDQNPKAKFYQASTSEMYGNSEQTPQNEKTPFNPVSPYGKSKRDAHIDFVNSYREKFGMFAVGGILFNHDSPRRGMEFVTRKISHHVAKIKLGMENKILMGNINAKRDWGFAGDYVKAMWLMMQQEDPENYVIATGTSHSVKDFLDLAFETINKNYETVDLSDLSEEQADEQVAKLGQSGTYVILHPRFFRPVDINLVLGDPSKAEKNLGWKANTSFEELVKLMVNSDLELLKNQVLLTQGDA